MSVRERKRSTVAELAALLEAGDNRSAARLARQVLSEDGAGGGDRDAARATLARVRPDRAGTLAVAAGLLLFAGAALLGLFGI